MTDLAHEPDGEQQNPEGEADREPVETPEAPVVEDASDETVADAPTALEEESGEAAAGTSEAAVQVSQDALFNADLAPAVQPAPSEDEGVTAFGGEPDDLEAVRAALGGDGTAPVAEGEAQATALEDAAPAEVSAESAAENEAVQALVEAGVPEGAADDADAVEALLDEEAAEGLLERPDRTLTLPFYIYDGVWLVFAIAMVVALRDAAVANTLDTAPAYPPFVLVGLVLTVLGPLMAVFLWWVKRSRVTPVERTGLFAVAMLRGALATFAGVMLWTIARVVLDYLRTGRFF